MCSSDLGTGGIGKFFGPITLVWFIVLVALGLPHIMAHPAVLVALNPAYAAAFVAGQPLVAFIALEFIQARSKVRLAQGFLVAIALFIVVFLVFQDELQDYRVITIFTEYEEDLSVLDRKKMLADGLDTILQHPWTGRMGSYLGGEYIHKIGRAHV